MLTFLTAHPENKVLCNVSKNKKCNLFCDKSQIRRTFPEQFNYLNQS